MSKTTVRKPRHARLSACPSCNLVGTNRTECFIPCLWKVELLLLLLPVSSSLTDGQKTLYNRGNKLPCSIWGIFRSSHCLTHSRFPILQHSHGRAERRHRSGTENPVLAFQSQQLAIIAPAIVAVSERLSKAPNQLLLLTYLLPCPLPETKS